MLVEREAYGTLDLLAESCGGNPNRLRVGSIRVRQSVGIPTPYPGPGRNDFMQTGCAPLVVCLHWSLRHSLLEHKWKLGDESQP